MKQRIISGIQPTNRLTIGNYLGAIKHLVNYQDKYDAYIFIADLHAISVPFDKTKLYENKINLIVSYLAAGLDLEKNTIFFQSDVPAHNELN
jgi:tryptophanyl-tRNA synthetase